jgi:hypothetical protein
VAGVPRRQVRETEARLAHARETDNLPARLQGVTPPSPLQALEAAKKAGDPVPLVSDLDILAGDDERDQVVQRLLLAVAEGRAE